MIYALHEGLRQMLNEGMAQVHARHALNDQAIQAGIEAMGLSIYGERTSKMATVTPIIAPKAWILHAFKRIYLIGLAWKLPLLLDH